AKTMMKRPRRLELLLPSFIYLAHWSMNLAKESHPIYAFYLPLSGGALLEDDVSKIAFAMFYSVKKMIPGGKDGRKVCKIIGKFLEFLILYHLINYKQNEEVGISVQTEHSSTQKTPRIKNLIVEKSHKKLEKSFLLEHKIKKGDKRTKMGILNQILI
ncbi:3123_t:CDS:2, partial [Gigaspora margarita]